MTDREQVRLLIGGSETTDYITDGQIDSWLSKYSVRQTAYLCLLALAANQAFLAYMVRTLTYASKNDAARELRMIAREMKKADEDEPAGGAAEIAVTDQVATTIIYNRWLRES